MIENWLKTTKERGLDGQKLLDAARAAIKKHESAPDEPARRSRALPASPRRRRASEGRHGPTPLLRPRRPQDSGAARIARVAGARGRRSSSSPSRVLVTASVLMRWLGGEGVNGDFELVQMGLALAVFAFLPLCQAHARQRHGRHLHDPPAGAASRRHRRALGPRLCGLRGLHRLAARGRRRGGARRATRPRWCSRLPIHYAIGACAAMAAFLALIGVLTAVRRAGASSMSGLETRGLGLRRHARR